MKIGIKLFLGFLCMTVLTVGILWIVQAGFMHDSYLNERVEKINRTLDQASRSGEFDYQQLEDALDINILTMDQNGDVLYISTGMPMRGMMIKTCASIAKSGDTSALHTLDMMGNVRYAMLARRIGSNTLFAVFSLTNVEEASTLLKKQLWVVTLALIAFSVMLAVVLSKKFSRPIREVTVAARDLAAGQLDIRLPVQTGDEIGQMRQALNDLALQLQKTENLQKELIANVSHELRSPLSIIRGYAETVRDVTWPYEQKRTEQLTLIADEAQRLSGIVTDILDYSRLQSDVVKIQPEQFALRAAVEKAAQRHMLTASKKGVSIRISGDGDGRFDLRMFQQVMDNLISNAVNYGDEGSTIDIKIGEQADGYRLSVQNTGSEIPKDEIANIWDRFYRVDQTGENKRLGIGLGLAIVKSILVMHQSEYGVQSDDGKTEFWFAVPRAAD